jgi:hypothetical protein
LRPFFPARLTSQVLHRTIANPRTESGIGEDIQAHLRTRARTPPRTSACSNSLRACHRCRNGLRDADGREGIGAGHVNAQNFGAICMEWHQMRSGTDGTWKFRSGSLYPEVKVRGTHRLASNPSWRFDIRFSTCPMKYRPQSRNRSESTVPVVGLSAIRNYSPSLPAEPNPDLECSGLPVIRPERRADVCIV